ncbi:MAG: MMPL family transporter, partial [Gammaproteobacteria bacterium]|nr:MMPL family transporter [Gammaproteobacteria bacterium]
MSKSKTSHGQGLDHQMLNNNWITRYTEWVIKHPWVVLTLTVIIAFALASGGKHLTFNNDYRVFFSEDNPQLKAFDEVQNVYTKNDNALLVITPTGDYSGEVFTPDVLTAIEYITARAWEVDFSLRVDSITNFQHTRAKDDDLIVEDLVSNPGAMTPAQLAAARDIALNDPLLVNRLISDRAHVTAVNITFQLAGNDPSENRAAVASVRDLIAEAEQRFPFIQIRETGMVFMNAAFDEASTNDLKTLIPMMFGGILLFAAIMLRSVLATISLLIVIVLSVMTAMGSAGHIGMFLSGPTVSAPPVITTLAVADCIHILVTLFAQMRHGLSRRDAIVESMRINMGPVFVTSITTAIGFLTMNFSDVPPFRDLGNIVAIGVMLAFFFSVFTLPALVAILPMKGHGHAKNTKKFLHKFADFVIAKRNPLLIGIGLLSIITLAMVPKNELNDEFVKYFKPSIEFRQHTDYTAENLTGIYIVQYSIPSGETNGISDPQYLRQLENWVNWYRAQPQTIHVNVINDILKRLNMNMHGDDPSMYKIPDRRNLAAQYLLLYEMSLPYGLDLNNQIDIDKSSTQVVVTLENMSTAELRKIVDQSEQWLSDNAPALYAQGTG